MTTRYQAYYGSTTAGTAISSGTSGFRKPDDMAGVVGIAQDGVNGENLDIEFEKSTHRFALERVPALGEIAVNTRVNKLGFTPCYWPLGQGEGLKITPRGSESSSAKIIYVIWGDSSELSKHPPIHWGRCDAVTHGTTADGAKIADIPEECTEAVMVLSHGAGTTAIGLRFKASGTEHTFPSNHGALNSCEEQPTIHRCSIPKQSDLIQHVVNSNYFTGTAVLTIYIGWLYN